MNTETIMSAIAGMGATGAAKDLDPGLNRTSAARSRAEALQADADRQRAEYEAQPLFESIDHRCTGCGTPIRLELRGELSEIEADMGRRMARLVACSDCCAFNRLRVDLEETRKIATNSLERLGIRADGIRRRLDEFEEGSPEYRELIDNLIELEAKAAEARGAIRESSDNLRQVESDFEAFKALRATQNPPAGAKDPAPAMTPAYDDVDF